MKKIVLFSTLLFLWACATTMVYDQTKFSITPGVKLLNINTNSMVRERDGQMTAQIMGVSANNQSVYYKVEWFDVNGMRISTSLAQWKKVNLRKNAEFLWNVVSPSRRAATYKVYITNDIGKGIIE